MDRAASRMQNDINDGNVMKLLYSSTSDQSYVHAKFWSPRISFDNKIAHDVTICFALHSFRVALWIFP